MTTLPPLEPAVRSRFIALAIISGVLCLLGVVSSMFVGVFLEPCTTPQACIDASDALLAPTLALVVGPMVLFGIGGVTALVLRARRRTDFWVALLVTAALQVAWIAAWFVVIALR